MCPEVRGLLQEFQKRIPEPVRPYIRWLILFGSATRTVPSPQPSPAALREREMVDVLRNGEMGV